MSNAAGMIIASCPHCQKRYTVRPEHLGRSTQCKQCDLMFTLAAPEDPRTVPEDSASGAGATADSGAAADAILCPICQGPLSPENPGAVKRCSTCGTGHHADCWEYNRGCGLYGCKEAPETEKLQEIEIPASYWGQTQKACPKCGQVIQAAAVRCRHCGVTFETARPQEAHEFAANVKAKQSQEGLKRFGNILLIAGILPCTAPIAAIVGLVWYFISRNKIRALPALNATICRLAVGVAVTVSLIMLIAALVHSSYS